MSSFVKEPGLSSVQHVTDPRKDGYGIQHNFKANDNGVVIKIGVMLSKKGWVLANYYDPNNRQPERKTLIVSSALTAAQRFIDTKFVGLKLQPY
jgi:hypothetical protein